MLIKNFINNIKLSLNGKNLYYQFLTLLLVAFVSSMVISAASVFAENGNGSQQTLRNNNNFYAYVTTSDNLDVSIEKVRDDGPGPQFDATVIVSRPGAADVSCTITTAQPTGTQCNWNDLTATSSGVWRVRFEVPNQTFEYYSWTINVQNGSTNIPGRVWSNAYYFSQNGDSTNAAQATNSPDIKMWYKSRTGYLYEVDYLDYYGIDSVFQANSFGIVEDGACNAIYKSAPIGQAIGGGLNPDQVVQSCGGEYKVFFEEPSSDLPDQATRWDGVTEWLGSNSEDPTITNTSFTKQGTNTLNGVFKFTTTNYTGDVTVQVDTNQNGNFDDNQDRTFNIGATLNSEVTLNFDGKDGLGNYVPNGNRLLFRVTLGKLGEIHFVNTDPEKRGGGIQVMRHTGSTTGRDRKSVV